MARPIIDSHLDISFNALSYDRDQTLTIAAIRDRESTMPGVARGKNTVSLPELRRTRIGVCLATLLARSKPGVKPVAVQERPHLDYANQDIAHAVACGQLGYYRRMQATGEMRQIRDAATLQAHWDHWERWSRTAEMATEVPTPGQAQPIEVQQAGSAMEAQAPAIGFILSMEGCDPITHPGELEWWFDQGLRTASLAHYGQGAYGFGTGGDGPVTSRGFELLKEFSRAGMILDLTHTALTAFFQCLDRFSGPVFASHNNLHSLVPGDRQFNDEQVKAIVARGGVIGAVMDAWMLYPKGWKRGVTSTSVVSMNDVANHIDRVCQLAGNAKHAAIGSDLDGDYGYEQTPHDLNTIFDLQKLDPILKSRGYSDADIDLIFFGNWLRFFNAALPRG